MIVVPGRVPTAEDAGLLERIHREFLPAHGLAPTGSTHEIYLGDPRRADPATLRTILRQPVGWAARCTRAVVWAITHATTRVRAAPQRQESS